MSQENRQPSNLNHLSPLSYTFQIHKAPAVSFFCQRAMIPSIEFPHLRQETPLTAVKRPSTSLDFADLSIDFLVDEELSNWLEIFDWMVQVGFPKEFGEFNEDEIFHDATLTVMTNKGNPFYRFNFKDVFPVSLGELEFSTNEEATEIVASAEFAYTRYEPEKI